MPVLKKVLFMFFLASGSFSELFSPRAYSGEVPHVVVPPFCLPGSAKCQVSCSYSKSGGGCQPLGIPHPPPLSFLKPLSQRTVERGAL